VSAGDALGDVAAARRAVADRLITPWWFHPLLGVALAGNQLAYLAFPPPWPMLGQALMLLGAVGVPAWNRRRTGVQPAYQGGWSRLWLVGLIACGVLTFVASTALHQLSGLWWPSVLIAIGTVVGVIAFGRGYDAALRAELRERP